MAATARLRGLAFSLLFWAFRSVLLASLVLGMLPFTLIGGLAALALAGLHLSVSAAVGFIAVAGISIQNGVILVEEVMQRLREEAASMQAVVQGAAVCLRPILMTALMAGLGLLPAALSRGIGSETQRDTHAKRAWLTGVELELTAREWRMLEYLVRRPERVVSKEQIQHSVAGEAEANYNAVEVYMSRLRAKLEPAGVRIRTVRGFGYVLEDPPAAPAA